MGRTSRARATDNIFSCPRVGKLSFRFDTTTGNQLRALTFEIIQRQLKSVGIELVPRFQTAGVMFGTTLPSSDWDLMLFTWVESPGSKITSKDIYGCGGDDQRRHLLQPEAPALLNKVRSDARRRRTRTKLLNAGGAEVHGRRTFRRSRCSRGRST